MKLKVPDWKSAWFDHHISDRFFQEMSRLEKGAVMNLETSAHWMEQLMIDMGQLAQAMIRLESRDTPDPQIRQAFDKALKLSALSLQLTTALDNLARTHAQGWSSAVADTPDDTAWAQRQISNSAYPMAPPTEVRPTLPNVSSSAQRQAAPGAELGIGSERNKGNALSRSGGSSPTVDRVTSLPPVQHRIERARPIPPQNFEHEFGDEEPSGGFLSSMVDVSGDGLSSAPSQMHQTIRSLSDQGLSRAEIEVVTGEPRHIIEAVLNHQNQA